MRFSTLAQPQTQPQTRKPQRKRTLTQAIPHAALICRFSSCLMRPRIASFARSYGAGTSPWPLYFLREFKAPLTAPTMAGITEIKMIPKTMVLKCCCTNGTPPKK